MSGFGHCGINPRSAAGTLLQQCLCGWKEIELNWKNIYGRCFPRKEEQVLTSAVAATWHWRYHRHKVAWCMGFGKHSRFFCAGQDVSDLILANRYKIMKLKLQNRQQTLLYSYANLSGWWLQKKIQVPVITSHSHIHEQCRNENLKILVAGDKRDF